MRRGRLHRVLSLAFVASLTLAMSNYDDPRVLLSYKDGGLAGGRDILRVTAAANEEGQLVFEVMTRAPGRETGPDDYVSLQISQRMTRQFLVPVDAGRGVVVVDYAGELAANVESGGAARRRLSPGGAAGVVRARRLNRGVEFLVPLDWIDYHEKISFDAFTVRGRTSTDGFLIEEVYDRAAKGVDPLRRVAPVTLLNDLCSTR